MTPKPFYSPGDPRRAPVAASLALASACALATLTGCFSLDTGPALQIRKSVASSSQALPTIVAATGGTGTVAISGRIVGRLPCDVLDGDVRDSGGNLRVTILLVADQNSCPGSPPITWSYVANVLNLDPGARTLRVEHRFQGVEGQAGVVLDTLVEVR